MSKVLHSTVNKRQYDEKKIFIELKNNFNFEQYFLEQLISSLKETGYHVASDDKNFAYNHKISIELIKGKSLNSNQLITNSNSNLDILETKNGIVVNITFQSYKQKPTYQNKNIFEFKKRIKEANILFYMENIDLLPIQLHFVIIDLLNNENNLTS